MPRTYLPESELERENLWLDLIEAGVEDTGSIAQKTGFTRRRIQQRIKTARARREAEGADHARPIERLDRFDYPYMELVDAPPDEELMHEWATTEGTEDDPEISVSRGRYHIGGRVKLLQGGVITTDDTSRTDGKPQPTTYSPTPGLKGGVG